MNKQVPIEESLWDTPIIDDKDYVIYAGKSKYDRDLYVSVFRDSKEWEVNIIPCIMKKDKAEKVLKKVMKECNSKSTIYLRSLTPDCFSIKEWN